MKQIEMEENLFAGAVSFEKGEDWIKPWRLPFEKLKMFPSGGRHGSICAVAETPAGVRLRFRTASSKVGLTIVGTDKLDPFLTAPGGQPAAQITGPYLFDLTIDGDRVQTVTVNEGENHLLFDQLPGSKKEIEIWLPQRKVVVLKHLLIDDEADIDLPEDTRKKWIAYGSSITHCRNAHSPARTWPGGVARRHNLNLTCLGYGSNCQIEPMVAMMIRDLPADFISLKVGINVYGTVSMGPRMFKPNLIGFVHTIRDGHPEIPIAVISPAFAPKRETKENAAGFTLVAMREEVEDAVRRLVDCGDRNITYYNGLDLFGENLAVDHLPDGVHPSAEGYEILGENFSRIVIGDLNI